MANMIRNISQTTQEREIVKTAPDIIVYFDGTPYLQNPFVNDRKTGNSPAVVNFNDYVTAFQCSYDTDIMVPNATLTLQVPNHLKFQFQMPGGNNLIQPMMQVQVYAKGYFMSSQSDTVYRRVFKGLVSHIAYSDNGKMLEVQVQCQGTLEMLRLMQINLSPSLLTAAKTGSSATYWTTRFAQFSPYKQIAAAFAYGLSTDGFQLNNLTQTAVSAGRFAKAIQLGYINKWQAILANLAKDVHIFGASWKDNPTTQQGQPGSINTKQSQKKGSANQDEAAHASGTIQSTQKESDEQQDIYYGQIRQYTGDRQIAEISLYNNQIVSRLDWIRKIVHMIDFEAYQDVDGKIIVKPPLYNLDVTNIGLRTPQTSTQSTSRSNSYLNPLTQVTPQTNPFVVYLSEILSEQETEDQAAIRRTRTVVSGNVDVKFQFGYNEEYLSTSEYIDVGKLIKFGLREEPVIYTPWFKNGHVSLFAHAVAETVRANRGYRTYTVTIPMRPELKLGFPVFFPHRDMYGYIKSINLGYQVGQTATMTITCDSIRRRFLVNTTQYDPSLYINNPSADPVQVYTSAPDMVLKWTKTPQPNQPAPGQSPAANNNFVQQQQAGIIQGGSQPALANPQTSNLTNLVGTAITIPSPDTVPTDPQSKVDNRTQSQIRNTVRTAQDVADNTSLAQYFIQNDGDQKSGTVPPVGSRTGGTTAASYYKQKRVVDKTYIEDIKNGTIPFSDGKGYEVIAPFPWGRYQDLNTAIKIFTEDGWVDGVTDINGNPVVDPQDLAVLQGVDAFLYAGLSTPISTKSTADLLQQFSSQVSNTIGGTFTSQNVGGKPNTATLDATVLVLQYQSGASNDSQLTKLQQPEDALVQGLVTNTQNYNQRLIDVLVSGSIAPTQQTQEALRSTVNPTPLTTQAVGSTPAQQAQQADQFASTPSSNDSGQSE